MPTEIKTLTQKIVKLLEKQENSYHYNYYMGTLRYIIRNLEQEKAKKPTHNKTKQRRS